MTLRAALRQAAGNPIVITTTLRLPHRCHHPLVFYGVFWRVCDWYTNRAHNLHVRTNACACAHAQAHADLSIRMIISVFPVCVRRPARRAHPPCALACALSHVRRSRGHDQARTLVQILGNFQYSLQSLDATSTDARVNANTVPNCRDTTDERRVRLWRNSE